MWSSSLIFLLFIIRSKKRANKIWSNAKTERVIQSVEKQPVLYDVTMSNYKNNVSQATARAVIGREFSISMLFITFSTNYCKYILLAINYLIINY